jgi:hypothetical protein
MSEIGSQNLPMDGLIRSYPALSPSPLGLCNLCRSSQRAPFAVAKVRNRRSDVRGQLGSGD